MTDDEHARLLWDASGSWLGFALAGLLVTTGAALATADWWSRRRRLVLAAELLGALLMAAGLVVWSAAAFLRGMRP